PQAREAVERTREKDSQKMDARVDREPPRSPGQLRVAVEIPFHETSVWDRGVQIDRDVMCFRALKDSPVRRLVQKAAAGVTVDHRALEAELRDGPLEFLYRRPRIRRRQGRERGEARRVRLRRLVHEVVRFA